MEQPNIPLVRKYFAALAKGDLAAAGALFADDIVWHQPGRSALSRSYRGKGELFPLLGQFMELSQGTFQIDEVRSIMANGDHVAATIHFRAQRGGGVLSMDGVDLMRVEGGLIREVWLFSADQGAEDQFWDEAASAAHA
jgi:uncharacterized protein